LIHVGEGSACLLDVIDSNVELDEITVLHDSVACTSVWVGLHPEYVLVASELRRRVARLDTIVLCLLRSLILQVIARFRGLVGKVESLGRFLVCLVPFGEYEGHESAGTDENHDFLATVRDWESHVSRVYRLTDEALTVAGLVNWSQSVMRLLMMHRLCVPLS